MCLTPVGSLLRGCLSNVVVSPPVADDSIHSSVANLLKSEIAEVKPSMHAVCLHETATAFGLMI